jgi:hypothetical protein
MGKPKRTPEFDEDDDYVRLVTPYRASWDNATARVSFKRMLADSEGPSRGTFQFLRNCRSVPAEEH